MSTLASMITDLCARAGLDSSLVDTSQISTVQPVNVPGGYIIEHPGSGAQALKEIMDCFFIDACESSGKLVFVPRSSAAGKTIACNIPEPDLGLRQDGAELEEHFAQEQDLPQAVTVMFNNVAINYQEGKQFKERNSRVITVATKNQLYRTLPFTLTDDQARQICECLLYSAWANRDAFAINLWKAFYLLLDPTDLITLVYEGQTFQVRLVSSVIGQSGAVALEAVTDDPRNYESSVVGGIDAGFQPPTLRSSPLTLLWLFDLPLLRDQDSVAGSTGFYAAMSSPSPDWASAGLYASSDDANFSIVDFASAPAAFGYATTTLAAPRSPWTWDTANSLTVRFTFGSPAGDTDLNVLNGSNAAIVGDEIIQFATATENLDGTYTLSRLLRGRRGTEGAAGSHGAAELVVLLNQGGILREPRPLTELGALRYYRAVTSGQTVADASDVDLTLAGNDLKPYAPVHIAGTRDGSNNLTLIWIRRTRIGWISLSQDPVPLSENSELYDVDILNGSTVVRTLANLTSPTATYSAADQTTDFGSPQSAIAVKVYQKSAQVGRGFPGGATV